MSEGIAKNKNFLKKKQFLKFFNEERKMKILIGENQEPKKGKNNSREQQTFKIYRKKGIGGKFYS